MHVLIIEATLTGHHSGYLERIAFAYMNAGHSLSVTVLQRETTHPTLCRLKTRFGNAFSVAPLDDAKYVAAMHSRLGEPRRELALRRIFGQAYQEINEDKPVDYVFLPYMDYCLYALGVLGSPFGRTPWGGICMRPSFHYACYGVIAPKPKLANVKRALFLKLLRSKTLKSVYTIDELLHRFIAERHSPWTSRLRYLPDPAELKGSSTYESARHALGISEEAVVVLVYGAIDERKGLEVLVAALSSSAVPKELHLLVVGRQSASIEPLMQSAQVVAMAEDGRLHVINDFVDDAVEQMVFVAADIVWLGYRGHYAMSGVLVLAALTGKPVIATQDGLIGWYARKWALGFVIDTKSIGSVSDALQSAASNRRITARGVNGKILTGHDWMTFATVLLSS